MHGVRGCVCVFKCGAFLAGCRVANPARHAATYNFLSLTNSHTQNGLRYSGARLLGAPRAAHEVEKAPLPQLEEIGLRVGSELVRLHDGLVRRRDPVVQVLAPRPVAHAGLVSR